GALPVERPVASPPLCAERVVPGGAAAGAATGRKPKARPGGKPPLTWPSMPERVTGIEPARPARKAGGVPLDHPRQARPPPRFLQTRGADGDKVTASAVRVVHFAANPRGPRGVAQLG